MIKRILLTTLIVVLSGGLLGCWFYFVGRLSAQGREQASCRRVEVILLDSLESAIVDRQDVQDYLTKRAVGKQTCLIDLDSLEKSLRARGEVMSAQVYAADAQTVAVRLTQRKPVIDKAREILGWEPTIPLREGLVRTIAYFDELLRTEK